METFASLICTTLFKEHTWFDLRIVIPLPWGDQVRIQKFIQILLRALVCIMIGVLVLSIRLKLARIWDTIIVVLFRWGSILGLKIVFLFGSRRICFVVPLIQRIIIPLLWVVLFHVSYPLRTWWMKEFAVCYRATIAFWVITTFFFCSRRIYFVVPLILRIIKLLLWVVLVLIFLISPSNLFVGKQLECIFNVFYLNHRNFQSRIRFLIFNRGSDLLTRFFYIRNCIFQLKGFLFRFFKLSFELSVLILQILVCIFVFFSASVTLYHIPSQCCVTMSALDDSHKTTVF